MTPLEAIAGTPNACQVLPNLVTGGQPGVAQFQAAKAAGATVILDIRDPREQRPFDEPAEIAAAGMTYVNIPVGHGPIDDATFDRIRDTLRNNANGSVVFHCASGSRVGGTLIPYLVLDLGMEDDAATQQAMRCGLRSADLMQAALDYVQRHRLA